MSTTKAETNLGVISPTGHVVVTVGDIIGENDTVTLEADDYNNINEFYAGARQKMLDEHNRSAVKLHVYSIDAGFDSTDFLINGGITNELWVMMQLESHEIEMLYTYQDETGINVADDVAAALDKALQKHQA